MSHNGATERRAHDRFSLRAMYTNVEAHPIGGERSPLSGHAYDVSESGVRVELDAPLVIGSQVALHMSFPGSAAPIAAEAQVIWINGIEDDPGPRRMAMRFIDFHTQADRMRLEHYLTHEVRSIAA